MSYDFCTAKYGFKKMEFTEIKQLEVGDEIAICVCDEAPSKMKFIKAKVTRPLFWNHDADDPDWEVETDNCFTDVHSIYKVVEL